MIFRWTQLTVSPHFHVLELRFFLASFVSLALGFYLNSRQGWEAMVAPKSAYSKGPQGLP